MGIRRDPNAPRIPRKDRVGASAFKVGALVIAVLCIATYFGFTKHVPLTHGFRVKAVFPSANSIRTNSPVRIAGVNVGKVKKIERQDGANAAIVTTAASVPSWRSIFLTLPTLTPAMRTGELVRIELADGKTAFTRKPCVSGTCLVKPKYVAAQRTASTTAPTLSALAPARSLRGMRGALGSRRIAITASGSAWRCRAPCPGCLARCR